MRRFLPTRRESFIALVAATGTLAAAELVRSQDPVQRSSVFDWNAIRSEPTETAARRRFFKSRTTTLEQLGIHVTTVNPGDASHASHRHPDEELILVKEGTVEQVVNGLTYRLGPGSVTFIAPNDEHGIRNAGDTAASYYIIRWTSTKTQR